MIHQIILTVAAVTAINVVLAVLLVIAERYLADFGECTLTVNDQKKLDVKGGSTLLATLSREKIFLPSACGGRGTCAYCKCRIQSGAGPLLPTEIPLLSSEEIENQVRLACQVKVKQDMAITIPEELFAIQEFRASVKEIRRLTHDIKLLRLSLLDPGEISFKSGQYIQLKSQPYADIRERVSRAYSISSPNHVKNAIDLIVRLVPEGICTTWVHEYLREGETVSFVGPMGDFFLRDGRGEIIMVAGGSGMAPMVSILHEMIHTNNERKVTYFFGAVTRRDLFYLDEMNAFRQKLPNFKFIPALSEPLPEDSWDGETGLITEILGKYLKGKDTSDMQGYLCGSPGMIQASIQVMKEHHIEGDRIFFDPFA